MSIERVYYCDADCPCHARTGSPPPHLPSGFIETRERTDHGDELHHFCCWPCAMTFAADQPIPEVIEMDEDPA